MDNQDMAMLVVGNKLEAYDRVRELALFGEPAGPHRRNGAYLDGWHDAMSAIRDALRGELL